MIKKLLLIFLLTYPQFSHSSVEVDFNIWLKTFKIIAQKNGISEETINNSLKNAKYLTFLKLLFIVSSEIPFFNALILNLLSHVLKSTSSPECEKCG